MVRSNRVKVQNWIQARITHCPIRGFGAQMIVAIRHAAWYRALRQSSRLQPNGNVYALGDSIATPPFTPTSAFGEHTGIPAPLPLTDTNFVHLVEHGQGVVFVDFWAPWCGPCVRLSPIVDALATQFAGKVTIGNVNVDEHVAIARKYRVLGIPTVLIFRDGRLHRWIRRRPFSKTLSPGARKSLARSRNHRLRGRFKRCSAKYEARSSNVQNDDVKWYEVH